MIAQEIRKAYLDFFKSKQHKILDSASLIPQNDPSTLFTGSGMQPLLPYLLGEPHPQGNRLADSQVCLRAMDIEEIGDNHHTTFFEMLGNWSLGDYFKEDEIHWFWEFLTNIVKLDPQRIYISCYSGDESAGIAKDTDSAAIWKEIFSQAGISANEVDIGDTANGYELGEQSGRIFFYKDKNWWCRTGSAQSMPIGEPGGPDTEAFYLFPDVAHDVSYGKLCHVNCDCGRYIEIGNAVFMEYIKTEKGFEKLPSQNVDFGGGLERLTQASIGTPDIFRVSVIWPIIEMLIKLSGKDYEANNTSMRIIADHMRGAAWLAADNVVPSNKEQGYLMRRLIRRALRQAFSLGIEQNLCEQLAPVIIDMYKDDYPNVAQQSETIVKVLVKEEKIFRQTLRSGVREFSKMAADKLTGETVFSLYDTYGFPVELSLEEAFSHNLPVDEQWRSTFDRLMSEQRDRSRTATKGEFKGGLADHSVIITKYHTATHLLYRALKQILGNDVVQRGCNITADRIRFDFSYEQKLTPEQLSQVETIVNEQISHDWPVSWREENTKNALANGVAGAFGDRYGETVKVYTIGDPEGDYFSREICGGPHVSNTAKLAEGGKRFKIIKEESSSAGVRRIKAILQ